MLDQIKDQVNTRRILCIDGGGIKGVLPAAFLKTLEEDLEQPIGSYFDLIVGTSTGGILAIGLGLGLSANEILEFYKTSGPVIFGQKADPSAPQSWLARKIKGFRNVRRFIEPKHDADILAGKLKKVLKNTLIGDSKTRLVIPA
jgi:patatin-like phospholipase/acyl hydrolase